MNPAGEEWWCVDFYIRLPADQAPKWEVDLILAHRIILPLLHQHRNSISKWRFHRRARCDSTGHQFQFWFLSSSDARDRVEKSLGNSSLLDKLKKSKTIERTICRTSSDVRDPDDKSWSKLMKETWHYCAMGTSQMWLALIDECVKETVKENPIVDDPSIQELCACYEEVTERITEFWCNYGGRLLHQLNGIFEYGSIGVDCVISEKKILYRKVFVNFDPSQGEYKSTIAIHPNPRK